MGRKDGDPLPRRGGFFPPSTRHRTGDPDGWTDKKRDDSVRDEPSTDHVGRHRRDGFPLGKRNP